MKKGFVWVILCGLILAIGIPISYVAVTVIAVSQAVQCVPVNMARTLIQLTPLNDALNTSSDAANKFLSSLSSDAMRTQAKAHANQIVQIGIQRGESKARINLIIEIGLQESNLQNLTYGHLDSLGLFQQRPSVMGGNGKPYWGTAEQIMNPVHSINRIYDEADTKETQPGFTSLSAIEQAIRIQVPSREAYYATWKWDEIGPQLAGEYNTSSTADCMQTVAVNSEGWRAPLDTGYKLGDGYGSRFHPRLKIWRMHNGQDLNGFPSGEPIYAVHDGVVTRASWYGSYGNFVSIDHGGVSTNYAHLSAYGQGLNEGDQVKAGQVIGFAGTTGLSTGTHLHFEVMIDGKFVDPKTFMSERGVTLGQ